MKRSSKIVIFLLLIFPLFYMGSGVKAEEITPEQKSQRFITIDFENVDIHLFIKYISELTGRNFVIDKTVKGNVTIVSPTKISEAEAYRVFESVLDVHGYTTVEAGAVTKIIPSVKARSENIRTFRSGDAEYPEDKIVTQLIPLKHTTPDEIKKVLAPLVSKTSVVIAHTQSGMLIVTETLSNIQRLIAIIESIDVAFTGEDMVVLPLEHASAANVSKVLNSLFQKTKSSKKRARNNTTVKLVPYERINALIVVATPSEIERVKGLVKLLDSEMKKDSGNIHVHYLEHANAEELSKVLNFLPTQAKDPKKKGKAPAISKAVKIMPDVETNSLIINASKNEYDVLANVINKLDIPRRMVYLEALILEVNATKEFQVGVEWATGGRTSDNTTNFGTGFTANNTQPFGFISGLGDASPVSATGLSFGVLKQGIQIGGITFPNIAAVLRAFENDADLNVISTPQILTTDNKKAEISVGENIPYQVSRNVTDNNTEFENYEYRDVSTKLSITPQINQADTLRLEIATEVIKLRSNENLRPETFKRTVDTTVVVRDGETVVIGGIIGQDTNNSHTKVPILGDIPYLGALFRSKTDSNTRTNMFIFITPKIIKNPADIAGVTIRKEAQMGEVMPQAKKELYRDVNASHAVRLTEFGYDKLLSGKNQEAKEYFLEALDIDPRNPFAHYNLGVIYEEEGNKAKAFRSYQDVILSGTTMTAKDSGDPESVGKTLIQLAKERIEGLHGGSSDEATDPFADEEGR